MAVTVEEDLVNRLGWSTAIILTGIGLGTVLEYLLKVVLTRTLGPQSYGVFIQSLAVVDIAAVIGVIGLHRGLPRFISHYGAKNNGEKVQSSVFTGLLLVLPVAGATSIILHLNSGFLAGFLSGSPLSSAIRLMSLSVLPLSLFYFLISVIRGYQNSVYKVISSNLVFPVVNLGLVFLMIAGLNVQSAVLAYIGGLLAALATASYLAFRLFRPVGDLKAMPVELLAFSWPLLMVAVLLKVIKWMEVLMLGWLMGAAQSGIYEVSLALGGFLTVFLSAVGYLFLPMVSELYSNGDKAKIKLLYSRAAKWSVLMAAPLLLAFTVFPAEILGLMFGEKFVTGSQALSLIAAGYFFMLFTGPGGRTLVGIGKPKKFLKGMLLFVLTDFGLNLLLIPRYGITGAAAAFFISSLVANLYMLYLVYRELGVLPLGKKVFSALALLGVVLAAALYASRFVDPGSFTVAAVLALSVLVYLTALVATGVFDEEKEMLLELLQEILGLLENRRPFEKD